MDLEAPAVGERGPAIYTAGLGQRDILGHFCVPVEPDLLAEVFQAVALYASRRQTDVLLDVLVGSAGVESAVPGALLSHQRSWAYELG